MLHLKVQSVQYAPAGFRLVVLYEFGVDFGDAELLFMIGPIK